MYRRSKLQQPQTNARILDTLLTKWEEMGYTFGTLDELYA